MSAFIEPFLIGGSVVAGAKYVSQIVNPAYAGLVSGMPMGLIASFFMADDKVRRKFYGGYMITDIVTALSITMLYILTRVMTKTPVNYISGIGYFIWLIVSFLSITYFKKNL